MAGYALGPMAAFSRPLIDEELPNMMALAVWSVDMELSAGRGDVQVTTFALLHPKKLDAPALARRHERNMRRDRV